MRRLAIILGSVAVMALAALVTVPWWLGVVLVTLGPRFDVQVGGYERVGYMRFRATAVEYRRDNVQVRLASVEADTPLVWGWRRLSGEKSPIQAGEWSVTVTPATPARPARKPGGWVPLRRQLERVATQLRLWLPEARAGAGAIAWPRGKLTLGPVDWQQGRLTSSRVEFRGRAAAAAITTNRAEPWRISLRAEDGEFSADLWSDEASVNGELAWAGQPVRVRAAFGAEGWRPTEASVDAAHWDLPASRVRLGAGYARLRGTAHLDWREERWSATVSAEGEPAPGSPAPPLRLAVKGRGDFDAWEIETLDLALPGATAHLTQPVAIDRQGRLASAGAQVRFESDLARLPWVQASGRITGEGRVIPGPDSVAVVEFGWRGEALEVFGQKFRETSGEGRLQWPQLRLQAVRAVTDAGEELRGAGGWDFRTRTLLAAEVDGRMRRAALARWLPSQPGFDEVVFQAHAEGPWGSLSHTGRLAATNVQAAGLRPLAVTFDWRGRGETVESFAAALRSGDSGIALAGTGDRQQLNLTALTLANGAVERLRLARPTSLHWANGRLELEPLELAGGEARIALEGQWAAHGRGRVAVRGLRAAWLRDFLLTPPVHWTLDALDAEARWEDGPAEFTLEGAGSLDLGDDGRAQLALRLHGDARELVVDSLRLAQDQQEIVRVAGRLPLTVRPFGSPRLSLDQQAPFALEARTQPNPRFWSQLTGLGGVDVVEPEVHASLAGTLAQPRGEVQVRAARIVRAAERGGQKWPRIEALDLRFAGTSAGIRLEHGAVTVEGQSVRATGLLPVAKAGWGELVREPQAMLRRGELHLAVPDADLAALAPYAPEYLAPKGRAQLDLTLTGDENLHGFLRVNDATLRPIGPLGVIQEIGVDLRFDGRRATVESVTGRMGGQPVTLQGRVDWPKGSEPRLDFTLRGENLPFVRRAGLLLRGDLDLRLETPAVGPVKISGQVRLRDSLFLTDVRSLIPSGRRGGGNVRPPYFAVATPPLSRWAVDITVEGERFLRLRTPVFNGVASVRSRLSGTLGDPRAEGEAIVNEGSVRLPFANFAVQQGQVRLTAEQVQPQIWLTGTTRRYGYDVRLELTGAVTSPNLAFSSSPPLEAEQVLLLVMAGQPPKNEVATTESQRMARVGAFFGQSLLGSFSGESGGADRLSVTSGENVSEQGRETYNIEYRLNRRWAVTGEYDEFDDYYAGLKWRFYEKGGDVSNAAE